MKCDISVNNYDSDLMILKGVNKIVNFLHDCQRHENTYNYEYLAVICSKIIEKHNVYF